MAIRKRPISPRQRMINLMYIVLMAMLALNVSSDVLDGFTLIGESLRRTAGATDEDNGTMYRRLDDLSRINPAKAGPWRRKALLLKKQADMTIRMADSLSVMIAREADGRKGDPLALTNKDDMEATAQVMLPSHGSGATALREALGMFSRTATGMTREYERRNSITEALSTPDGKDGKDWQHAMFESMPASAAIAYLRKLQADIRHAEGQALHSLLASVDGEDVRMNAFEAVVIPASRTVVKGTDYRADILMAAVDTTNLWELYIGGEETGIKDGKYSSRQTSAGERTISGWLQRVTDTGDTLRRAFSDTFTVIEPMATVSADMTNVLYAGTDNPISISVPGHSPGEVKATMTGGTLTRLPDGRYAARPHGTSGEAVISVRLAKGGTETAMGEYRFRVRPLPDPTPYVTMTDSEGKTARIRGGQIQRSQLAALTEVGAAIDDGILDIGFRVISFEAVYFDRMGNAVPVASDGPRLSERQKSVMRSLGSGRRFYITGVRVTGPDGQERRLPGSMELIVR